ncbi:hypothetical protein CDD83_7106 [Cordyceps sp. RAO-2017]|nr:hypothetical protein CDD83_7106 [Cordyceps sp. RAO-2017]
MQRACATQLHLESHGKAARPDIIRPSVLEERARHHRLHPAHGAASARCAMHRRPHTQQPQATRTATVSRNRAGCRCTPVQEAGRAAAAAPSAVSSGPPASPTNLSGREFQRGETGAFSSS